MLRSLLNLLLSKVIALAIDDHPTWNTILYIQYFEKSAKTLKYGGFQEVFKNSDSIILVVVSTMHSAQLLCKTLHATEGKLMN